MNAWAQTWSATSLGAVVCWTVSRFLHPRFGVDADSFGLVAGGAAVAVFHVGSIVWRIVTARLEAHALEAEANVKTLERNDDRKAS